MQNRIDSGESKCQSDRGEKAGGSEMLLTQCATVCLAGRKEGRKRRVLGRTVPSGASSVWVPKRAEQQLGFGGGGLNAAALTTYAQVGTKYFGSVGW